MLYTRLNFRIYVPDFDPDSCRLGSGMLFFRNDTIFPLFLFALRTAQQQCYQMVYVQGVSQLLKQSDWAQIQDFK